MFLTNIVGLVGWLTDWLSWWDQVRLDNGCSVLSHWLWVCFDR